LAKGDTGGFEIPLILPFSKGEDLIKTVLVIHKRVFKRGVNSSFNILPPLLQEGEGD